MKPNDYSYALPDALIAHDPAEKRDSSRLLVYSVKTDEVLFDVFSNIARYIPSDALLVLNDTRVAPARLELAKITGGAVRVLFLMNEWDGGQIIKGLPDRKISIGDSLFLNHRAILEAISQKNEEFSFRIVPPAKEFRALCDKHGSTPLPPYIHTTLTETAARDRYQTIFASGAERPSASVAAPTASLHFTDETFASLASKGVTRTFVTLDVGRGTFAPVKPADLVAGIAELHPEPIRISAETAAAVAAAKSAGKAVIAAGTTATRVLESASGDVLAGRAYAGETRLFIQPPFHFKAVDALITNFHLPNTSLLMLVDAFLQDKGAKRSWKDIYAIAVKEKMRFYSFGDAMLIV